MIYIAYVLAFLLDWHDIAFAIVVFTLGHYKVIDVTYPKCLTGWFEAQDLAPLSRSI